MLRVRASPRGLRSPRRALALFVGALAPAVAAAQRQALRPPEAVGPPPEPSRLVLTAGALGPGPAVPPDGLAVAVGCGPALDPASPELLRVRLGADGRAEVPLPWPELRAHGEDGSRMWARVVEEGWQRATVRFRAGRAPGDRTVQVFPRRGTSLRGRLLDGEGRPSVADEQGRFERRPVASEPIPADGRRRDVVWRPTPVLLVRVLGPDGRPWPSAVVPGRGVLPAPGEVGKMHTASSLFRRSPLDGPASVLVVPEVPAATAVEAPQRWEEVVALTGLQVDDGVEFGVEAGARYLVRVRAADGGWSLSSVEIPPYAERLVHEPSLPADALGTLTVLLRDAGGAPVRYAELRVEDPATGMPLAGVGLVWVPEGDDPSSRTLRLPAGRYRLVVQGLRGPGFCTTPLMPARAHGAFETSVTIEPDRETRVVARMGVGARLRARLVGSPTHRDHDVVRLSFTTPSCVEAWASRARLTLSGEGRWPADVRFESDEAPGLVLRHLELGVSRLSEPLQPGRYTLTARLPGGRTVQAPVELFDGRTTDVELEFPSR